MPEPRPKKRKPLTDRRTHTLYLRSGAVLALIVIGIGGIAYITRLPAFTVSRVDVRGAPELTESVRGAVTTALEGSYAFIIPKRFAYTLPEGDVRAAVLTAVPGVADVAVSRSSGSEVVVQVVEREPRARWCEAQCVLIDAHGYAFRPDDGVTRRTYSGREPVLGERFIENFLDLERLVTTIEGAASTTVQAVRVDGTDVYATVTPSGEVRFLLTADAATLHAAVSAVRMSRAYAHAPLEYIELRFANKVLAKFRE